jgi:CAAX protease family protein
MGQPRSNLPRIFLTEDTSRLRAGWRMAVHFLILTLMLTLAQLGVRTLWPKSSDETLAQLRRILPVGLVFIFSIYLARRYIDKQSFKSLGLKLNRYVLGDFIFGFVLSALEMSVVFFLFRMAGWLTVESWSFPSLESWLIAIAWLAGVWAIVGSYEELLFRGYWLENLSEGLGPYWAWFGTAVLFGLAHLANPNSTWLSTFNIFLVGISLGYARRRTQNLWLPIGMHTGWNFFQGTVFGFSVSGADSFRLAQTTSTGPELFTGGTFGREAGILIWLFVTLELSIVYLWTRNRV